MKVRITLYHITLVQSLVIINRYTLTQLPFNSIQSLLYEPDPLLGLLVARIVENRSLSQTGQVGQKGGYILGPTARNIITTYLLPGFLAGAEMDGHTALSRSLKSTYEVKGSAVYPLSVTPMGSQKSGSEGGNSSTTGYWGEEKAQVHREQQLSVSFGVSGVDAVALSVVCSMWLQESRTLDLVFHHCCSLGLFSAALSAQRPLLPLHAYKLFESFLTSSSSSSSSSSFTSYVAVPPPHSLSPSAGRVISDRVHSVLATAGLMRWLLVSSYHEDICIPRGISDSNSEIQVPLVIKKYRNRNLNFNSGQLMNALNAVEVFLVEYVEEGSDSSDLMMKHALLKKQIIASNAERRKTRIADQLSGEKYENSFKKACRAAYTSWKTAPKLQAQPSGTAAPQAAFDIFDQPVRRVNAPAPVPAAAAPQAAFDIFDQPVRRVNAPVPAPVPAAAAAAAPQAAFDIFDQPVQRVKESSRTASVFGDTAAATSVVGAVPDDQSPISKSDELDEDVALAMTRLKRMTATGTDRDIPTMDDGQGESRKSDTQSEPDITDAVRSTRRLRTPDRSPHKGSEVNSNIEASVSLTADDMESDIFQVAPPVRRLRAPAGVPDRASDTAAAENTQIPTAVESSPIPPTAPPSALDIFDMPPPVRRLRRSPISAPDPPPAPTVTAADMVESVSMEPESSS